MEDPGETLVLEPFFTGNMTEYYLRLKCQETKESDEW